MLLWDSESDFDSTFYNIPHKNKNTFNINKLSKKGIKNHYKRENYNKPIFFSVRKEYK